MPPSTHLKTPLHLDRATFHTLLTLQGPSLGLWRAAEVAALREQIYEPPVLDLGCGDGLVTSMVLPQVAIALDPDTKALTKAAKHSIYQQSIHAPIEQSQLPKESIGTILSNSVLEHIPNLDAALEAATNLLKPGGRLIFTVPTEAFSEWLALPLTHYANWRNQQLAHLNLWPIERWTHHLARAGLQVESIRPYLRQEWVSLWDWLELLQQIWIAERRLVGLVWKQIPSPVIDNLADWASQQDLSAPHPGGGRLIVARKIGGNDGND